MGKQNGGIKKKDNLFTKSLKNSLFCCKGKKVTKYIELSKSPIYLISNKLVIKNLLNT